MLHPFSKWALSILFVLGFGLTSLRAQVFFLRDTFCSNQFVVVNGHLYGPDKPTGTEIIFGGAASGADSIIEVRFVFYEPAVVTLNQTICADDTVWVNNVPYHGGFFIGQETIENGAANGCDSIININLQVVQSKRTIQQPICDGDTLFVNGSAYSALRPVGVERIPGGAAGGFCDSVIVVNLTVLPAPFSEVQDTLCPDSFLLINGHRYDRINHSGFEILPGAAANGCDSLVTVRLFFHQLWMTLGDDADIGYGDEVCLDPIFSFQPVSLAWSPALPCTDPACLPVCDLYFGNAEFALAATDPNGCTLLDTMRIVVSRKPPLYAPNVFKPTGDWPNNRFFLSAGGGTFGIKRMQIADRWGEVLYDRTGLSPNDPTSGWDGFYRGEAAPPGVYVFWAETLLWDGSTEIVKGSFALVR
ncbi:MAG: gliding motility-associated C-terminal domain-containing protein [Saprospiraceae bacterium]